MSETEQVKRRKKGSGAIKRLPSGRYQTRWTEGGKRKYGNKTYSTLELAEAELAKATIQEQGVRDGVYPRADVDQARALKMEVGPLVGEWHEWLTSARGERRARDLRCGLDAMVKAMSAKVVADLTAKKANAALTRMRATNAPHTLRARRVALMCFASWLADERDLLTVSPIPKLKRIVGGVQRKRSALDLEEQRELLAATETVGRFGRRRDGSVRWKLDGAERRLVYWLCIETGLRASEVRSLTVACFTLDDKAPCVRLTGGMTKNKKGATLRLRPDLAAALKAHLRLKGPAIRVFDLPEVYDFARMLRADLEVARRRWVKAAPKGMERKWREESDRLCAERHPPNEGEKGAAVDFHSLRKTLALNLAKAGVSPVKARDLMRHSTIQLTIDVYTEFGFGDLDDALEALPDLTTAIRVG
jgi:integrase